MSVNLKLGLLMMNGVHLMIEFCEKNEFDLEY